jgi:2-methylisocitrate lyase-like PEP mutase family enzyme
MRVEVVHYALAGEAWPFANRVPTGRSPVVSAEKLKRRGYPIVIYPTAGLKAACAAREQAYRHLERHGSTEGLPVPAYSLDELNTLVGFPEVWGFEKRWVESD